MVSDRARRGSGQTARVGRVLVVDDEPLIGRSLQLVLSDEFEVTATADAAEAVGWLTSGDWYDVILCDVMMPLMNGIELRDRVHAHNPELAARIVFVTGGILRPDVHALLDGVPNAVLAKPFDFPSLRELIRRRTRSTPPPRRASQP